MSRVTFEYDNGVRFIFYRLQAREWVRIVAQSGKEIIMELETFCREIKKLAKNRAKQ